jgi:hypothetical protein
LGGAAAIAVSGRRIDKWKGCAVPAATRLAGNLLFVNLFVNSNACQNQMRQTPAA